MAAELSEALSWAFDHAADFGGNPNEVRSEPKWGYHYGLCPSLVVMASWLASVAR